MTTMTRMKKMNEENVIYFELNDWHKTDSYPPLDIFETWIKERKFSDDEWCKRNRLCVIAASPDEPLQHWLVTATTLWVAEKCPELLLAKDNPGLNEYVVDITTVSAGYKKRLVKREYIHKKITDFLRYPDEFGNVHSKFGIGYDFAQYDKDNLGVTFYVHEDY